MQPTQVLRDEHENILAMLTVAQAAAQRLQSGQDIPRDLMLNAAHFFRNYADKRHHGKEEAELFPLMEQRGIARDGGPIGVMLAEHEQGRAFVRALTDAANRYAQGDAGAVPALIENALGFVNLLRQHIWKENNILFPMADQVLADDDQAKLSVAFERVEATFANLAEQKRYPALIAEYQKMSAGW